jgi:hypothetical protein
MMPAKLATGSLSANTNYSQYRKYHITLQKKIVPCDGSTSAYAMEADAFTYQA